MREILYKFDARGVYLTADDTVFGDDSELKLIAEPHDFSLTLGGDALRQTAFDGCTVVVSCEGAAVFYGSDGNEIARVDKGDGCFKEARLSWESGRVSVEFGQIHYIDNYPNCDGEHDRWDEVRKVLRRVTLDLGDCSVEVK